MDERDNRQAAEKYFKALKSRDINTMSEIIHDDYIEEYPQSGEQIRGKNNWRTMMESYPGLPDTKSHSFQVCGDLGIAEAVLEYPNGQTYMMCSVFEFKDGKIYRSRDYFGEPFQAPEWRSKWTQRKAAA